MQDEYVVIVEPNGDLSFVYSDELAEAFDGMDIETKRASHVEPATSFGWECNGWLADMRPVGGPVLYASILDDGRGTKVPFRVRQEALDAEREWIREHLGF